MADKSGDGTAQRSPMNVLVVAAHPDDEVLGCGATIARLSQQGDAVVVVILGEGVTSRYDDRGDADPMSLSRLHEQVHAVGAILGVQDVRIFDFPDNRFDTVPLLDIIKLIERLIGETKPEVIYTHHGGDLNIDHVILNRAVLTASRPMSGNSIRDVYAFEVPSSTEWAFQSFAAFSPNVFVDVNETIELKIRAMEVYDSEARRFPHPRSAEALRAISRRWGSVAGLGSAEAFQMIRSVR